MHDFVAVRYKATRRGMQHRRNWTAKFRRFGLCQREID